MKPVYQPFLSTSIGLSQTSTFQSVDRCSFVHENNTYIHMHACVPTFVPLPRQTKPNQTKPYPIFTHNLSYSTAANFANCILNFSTLFFWDRVCFLLNFGVVRAHCDGAQCVRLCPLARSNFSMFFF